MFSSKIRMTMRMYILNLLKGKINPEYILYPQDSGSLLYPSVTFCTKYIWQSFPGVLVILLPLKRVVRGKRIFPLESSVTVSFCHFCFVWRCWSCWTRTNPWTLRPWRPLLRRIIGAETRLLWGTVLFFHLRCFKSLTKERLKINWVWTKNNSRCLVSSATKMLSTSPSRATLLVARKQVSSLQTPIELGYMR